jgi:hypothetical protein
LLNHDLIKLIRLRSKTFIQKSKVPKFKTDNRIQVIDKAGYKIGFDALVPTLLELDMNHQENQGIKKIMRLFLYESKRI